MTPWPKEKGEAGKLLGMTLAADAQPDRVAAGRIALLRVLLASPDGTATIDDATTDLTSAYRDGGKWRGTVCRSLSTAGITERASVEQSDRPSRHRGYVTRWRLVDRRRATLMLAGLVAAMDARLSTAAALAAKNEAPTVVPVEALKQKTFPSLTEKGIPNGQTH